MSEGKSTKQTHSFWSVDPTEDLDCLAGVIEDSTDAVHLGKFRSQVFFGNEVVLRRLLSNVQLDPMEQDASCVYLKWPGRRLLGRM